MAIDPTKEKIGEVLGNKYVAVLALIALVVLAIVFYFVYVKEEGKK